VPSVKSYQNRKQDIADLKNQLQIADAAAKFNKEQLAKSEYQLRNLQQEYRTALATRDGEISRLYKEVQIERSAKELAVEFRQYDDKIIDALSNKVEELERQVRIYRQYIRYGVAFYPEQYTVTIPSFMKPFDSIEFTQKVNEVVPKL
jgi:hypothetical protein